MPDSEKGDDIDQRIMESKQRLRKNWDSLKDTYTRSPLETPCYRSTMLTSNYLKSYTFVFNKLN